MPISRECSFVNAQCWDQQITRKHQDKSTIGNSPQKSCLQWKCQVSSVVRRGHGWLLVVSSTLRYTSKALFSTEQSTRMQSSNLRDLLGVNDQISLKGGHRFSSLNGIHSHNRELDSFQREVSPPLRPDVVIALRNVRRIVLNLAQSCFILSW